MKQDGPGIDWAALHRYCAKAGYGQALATYLMFAEMLLGQDKLPKLRSKPDLSAMKVLREHVDPALRPIERDADLISYYFEASTATHVSGHCWKVTMPAGFMPGDHDFRGRTSRLQLYQGERELGPAFSLPRFIAEAGNGAYCHRGDELYFSTLGNLQPDMMAMTLRVKGIVKSDDLHELISKKDMLQSEVGRLHREIEIERLTVQNMQRSLFWRLRLIIREPRVALSLARRALADSLTKKKNRP